VRDIRCEKDANDVSAILSDIKFFFPLNQSKSLPRDIHTDNDTFLVTLDFIPQHSQVLRRLRKIVICFSCAVH